jgi:hypothetical protein
VEVRPLREELITPPSSARDFQALGIRFISLSESLSTSTPAGKMVFTVLGAVAESERLGIGTLCRLAGKRSKIQEKVI